MYNQILVSKDGNKIVQIKRETLSSSFDFICTNCVYFNNEELFQYETGHKQENGNDMYRHAELRVFNSGIALTEQIRTESNGDKENVQVDSLYSFNGTRMHTYYHTSNECFIPLVERDESFIENLMNNFSKSTKKDNIK